VRMGKKTHPHFYRGWTCPQDTRTCSAAGAMGSHHPQPSRRVYYVGGVYAQSAADPVERRLERPHGKCEWRGEKRTRITGWALALWSLWTRASGGVHSQQTTRFVAALLVCWRSGSPDGAQLHYLRGYARGPVSSHRGSRSPTSTGCARRARRT